MAKHDQRILKFLNQNADRTPTITEMMTRLSISVSDISESLISLQAQGLISKKVNSQGIECWFPGSSSPAQAVPSPVSAGIQSAERLPGHGGTPIAQATAQMPAMGGPIAVEARSTSEARSPFMAGLPDRSSPAPEAKPPIPRPVSTGEREAGHVQVQHMVAEPAPSQHRLDLSGSDRGGLSSLPQSSGMNVPPPIYGLAPAPRGVGILTLLAGLVAAVALSAFITTRLIQKEIRKASTTFVDRKSLTDANAALADFQDKTKAHVTALEAQVKQLSEQLAAKTSADSLKVAAAATPVAPKETAPAAKPGKSGKATGAKSSRGKRTTASARSRPVGRTAMSKAAARGAAMRKRAAKPVGHESGSEGGDATESSSSSPSAESPSVPNPPGLDDLPPPPSE